MSLSERSRAVLYRRLTTVIEDEEAVGEMLTNFPATEAERPATKDYVDKVAAEIRVEMHKGVNRLLVWMITLHTAQLGVMLTLLRKG